jgi:hypothetical protein
MAFSPNASSGINMPSVQRRSLIAVSVLPAGRNTDAVTCPIVRHTAAATQNFAWVCSPEFLKGDFMVVSR